jgi:hypothetical protein
LNGAKLRGCGMPDLRPNELHAAYVDVPEAKVPHLRGLALLRGGDLLLVDPEGIVLPDQPEPERIVPPLRGRYRMLSKMGYVGLKGHAQLVSAGDVNIAHKYAPTAKNAT